MTTYTLERSARASGVAAVVVSFAGILAAVASAPWFSWTANDLSDLGVAGGLTAGLFNYSLVAAGVLALPFAWWLAATATSRFGVLTAAGFAVTGACMAGVGLFPSDTDLHYPVAVGTYLGLTYTLALDASDAAVAGSARRALAGIWGALGHVTMWLVWGVVGFAAGVSGLALPEVGGSLLLAAWVVATARGRSQASGRRAGGNPER
ncbi:DUF998 domain-containing protein [Halobacterium jilantaiense]|uniref:Hypothetical membrane protein n=1 Tax=Halobacterium jilantaiense TaxID=355548 RepID=A0A1I0ND25_9EURY|nr:DUF998 domain-containing protein [Halobacterium jilantaiense]SEV99283.1 hypothetical membrane protein [Halobacterium jilantaiense]